MGNIWGFMVQTLEVSFIAVMLLVIKRIMLDKLSPRWQYGVWSILFLRIIIPVSGFSLFFPGCSVWIETIKAILEKGMNSNYTKVYEPITLHHILPTYALNPSSLTDILFILYGIGILLYLSYYAVSYIRLQILLSKAAPAEKQMTERLMNLCKQYNFNKQPYKIVTVEGLASAFVCGIFHPILVLPEDEYIDDKVLLHEMMHLKHYDIVQMLLWCICRSLHWCNPFLQYVFHRIENDMESLCDQRVLEQLEGEELRQYGQILLSMVNNKYARIPGTSSISNGGKNISRRIMAIVNYKRYPKGMTIVSLCIIILLVTPVITNASYSAGTDIYFPETSLAFDVAMAVARMNRCSTVAGALHTYATSLTYHNRIYLATVSSLSMHEALEEQARFPQEPYITWDIYTGEELGFIDNSKDYIIYNLTKENDRLFHAYLVLVTDYNDSDNQISYVFIPVTIQLEDAWVVKESGERIIFSDEISGTQYFSTDEMEFSFFHEEFYPHQYDFEAEREIGSFKGYMQTSHTIKHEVSKPIPNLDAEFHSEEQNAVIEYRCNMEAENAPTQSVKMGVQYLYSEEEINQFKENGMNYFEDINQMNDYEDYDYDSSSTGNLNWSYRIIDDEWKGTITCNMNHLSSGDFMMDTPIAAGICIFWDGKVVDEFLIDINGGIQ